MYKTIQIKGKRYRVDTERAKAALIVMALIAEGICFIGWCYWGWF